MPIILFLHDLIVMFMIATLSVMTHNEMDWSTYLAFGFKKGQSLQANVKGDIEKPSEWGSYLAKGPVKAESIVDDFIGFINEACTAFHAVEACRKRLFKAGFKELDEKLDWKLEAGQSYYFIRNGTTIISFTIGPKYVPGNGYTVIGAHTDSPCFKIKPVPCSKKADALVLNTQPYGGGLWHTWFDRDLGLAGRVILRNADGALRSQLVRINQPVARIPNLAIHLTAGTERDHFAPNLQEHAKALLTMDKTMLGLKGDHAQSRFHPYLVQLIAKMLKVPTTSIVDMELQLIDVQPSTLGGAGGEEYILSGRLDNLCSSYQSLRALIDATKETQSLENVCMAILFDHEEIGSNSCAGAGSSLFMDTLRLIHQGLTDGSHGSLMGSLRRSIVVSADMAHGQHPNYSSKHDPDHAPKINHGLVIKHNANQRYATTAVSATLLRELASLVGEQVQEFAVRSDSACGSTIGPILATLSGILTVDVGSPQFSMHSIREMMGARDMVAGYRIFKSVYINHHALSAKANIV